MAGEMSAFMKKGDLFWSIEVKDNIMKIKHGSKATVDGETEMKLSSVEAAQAEAYRHIKRMITDGYIGATPPKQKKAKKRPLAELFAGLGANTFIPLIPLSIPKSSNNHLLSRFGGSAFLHPNEKWPTCGCCGKALRALLQLNLDSIPEHSEQLPAAGIIQIFHCENNACETWRSFSNSTLCRFLPEELVSSMILTETNNAYPDKFVTSWRKKTDYPNNGETCVEVLSLTDEEAEAYDESSKYRPIGGDKLFGWPAFIQDPEYPQCPQCNVAMRFLFQLDSNDNIPYMWGDAGTCMIFYCSQHPELIAFNWSCS